MEAYLLFVGICLSVGIGGKHGVAALKKLEPERRTLETCEARLDQQQKKIQELQHTLNKMAEENKTGVTYVRWGRSACSALATTVYSGNFMTFLVNLHLHICILFFSFQS